tara:strand:- start:15988 stop:16635 length:648 start_codon:yes stop_codon:yes gene_type:complete
MRIEKIISLIENPDNILKGEIIYLDELISKYPYFQTSYLIQTKALLNFNSIRYNNFLKKTAAYCIDRKTLFNLITSKKIQKNHSNDVNAFDELKKQSSLTQVKIEESYSFSEWLSLHNLKKIKRKKTIDNTLINEFLNKNEIKKITNKKFFTANNAAKESLIENEELVTPTLAKVYFEQQHYEKAINAYKKLILKYPKKSTFFAAQIELIKNKIK